MQMNRKSKQNYFLKIKKKKGGFDFVVVRY